MMDFRRAMLLALIAVAFVAVAAGPPQRYMQQHIAHLHAPQQQRIHMVVLGDSLAYGTGASTRRHGYAYRVFTELLKTHPQSTYVNLAVPGATSVDVLRYQVPKLKAENAKLVLLTVGANDAFVYRDVPKFAKDYGRLLGAIRAAAPQAKIVVTGMPNASEISRVPDFARTIVATMCAMQNEVIMKESSVVDARIIDLYGLTSNLKKLNPRQFLSKDGLHPSDEGYGEIANAALPVVRAALRSN